MEFKLCLTLGADGMNSPHDVAQALKAIALKLAFGSHELRQLTPAEKRDTVVVGTCTVGGYSFEEVH